MSDVNQNEIAWGRNERGDLLIDGIVVEKNPHFLGDATSEIPPDDDEPIEPRNNAAVEGSQAEPVKAPEPEPEKAPEPPPPEPPKIPDKQKYKLMIRGELQEKEYNQDELVARLQMAESYGLKNDELREKHKKIEPFLHVFERPDFKEWLDNKMAMGEIPAPAAPQQPASEEIIRYRLRTQEPEFGEIRSQMIAWAATLPDAEAEILNNSHKAFNDAYDHFKSTRKAPTPAAPPPPPVVPKKEVEKAIAAKEVIKEQARVEPPGGAPAEVDPSKEYQKEYRRLQRAVRSGEKWVMYKGKRMESDIALVAHRMGD